MDFEKLWGLRQETQNLRQRLSRLRTAYESATTNYSPACGGGRGGDPVGRMTAEILDLKDQIADNEQTMYDMIVDVPATQLWSVMEAYYIKGLSWRDTAKLLGYSDASGPRRLVERFRG